MSSVRIPSHHIKPVTDLTPKLLQTVCDIINTALAGYVPQERYRQTQHRAICCIRKELTPRIEKMMSRISSYDFAFTTSGEFAVKVYDGALKKAWCRLMGKPTQGFTWLHFQEHLGTAVREEDIHGQVLYKEDVEGLTKLTTLHLAYMVLQELGSEESYCVNQVTTESLRQGTTVQIMQTINFAKEALKNRILQVQPTYVSQDIKKVGANTINKMLEAPVRS